MKNWTGQPSADGWHLPQATASCGDIWPLSKWRWMSWSTAESAETRRKPPFIHYMSCPALEYKRRVMVAFLSIAPFTIELLLPFIDSIDKKVCMFDPLPAF
jgi:hypothetical protein